MGGEPVIREGETFVWGRTREQAQELLAACDRIGVEQYRVRATDIGFIVPDPVWDAVEEQRRPVWSDAEAVI